LKTFQWFIHKYSSVLPHTWNITITSKGIHNNPIIDYLMDKPQSVSSIIPQRSFVPSPTPYRIWLFCLFGPLKYRIITASLGHFCFSWHWHF
jgi:hypothetical protein